MNDESTKELIGSDESETLAYGTFAQADVPWVGRTVCAFSNGNGGSLVIGHAGAIMQDPDSKIDALRTGIRDRLVPMQSVAVRRVDVGKRPLIIVDVPAGCDLPYTWDKHIYVRVGHETSAANGLQARELIQKRTVLGPRWERQVVAGVGLDDLDNKLILRVVQEADGGRLFVFRDTTDVWGVLRELDLAEGDVLRNSAYALFGRSPDKRFHQMRLRAIAYRGTDQDNLVDSRMFGGNLYEVLDQSLAFLKDHTPVTSDIPREGIRRIQRAAYPMPAMREALLNAIIHRDYSTPDGSASMAIYSDRVEIWNIGGLPNGMVIDDLKRVHASRPRNPDIAHLFMLHGQIERIGSGTGRIVREFRAAGLPEPIWRSTSGGIMVILPRMKNAGLLASIEDLNARQRAVLEGMKPGQTVKLLGYIEKSADGIKDRQARDDLKKLVEKGFMRRRGEARASEYVRTDKPLA